MIAVHMLMERAGVSEEAADESKGSTVAAEEERERRRRAEAADEVDEERHRLSIVFVADIIFRRFEPLARFSSAFLVRERTGHDRMLLLVRRGACREVRKRERT